MKILLLTNTEVSCSPDQLNTLPHKVKTIELSIYKCAPSLVAYCDTSNLPFMVKQLESCYEKLQHPSLIINDTATATNIDKTYDVFDKVYFLPSTSIGCWRTARDLPYRREIIEEM